MWKGRELEADLVRRTGGGWLAVARPDSPIVVAATARTEEDARAAFQSISQRWLELLDNEPAN